MYRLLPVLRPYAEQYMNQAYERDDLLARFGKAYTKLANYLYRELDRDAVAAYLAQQAGEDLTRGLDYIEPDSEEHGYYLLHWGWVLQRLGNRRQGIQLIKQAMGIWQGRYPALG